MALVEAYQAAFGQSGDHPSVRLAWDYSAENPRRDARGFFADRLAQDEEESNFEKLDRHRSFSFHEMKGDLALSNGARFYNDHTHPEYSSPECPSIKDLVVHDKAGERIVQACADHRNEVLGQPVVQVYKNNTDGHGHSYGCHDNYLLPRALPFEEIRHHLRAFLVTRQLFAGAGKLGIELSGQANRSHYQLSQRADFMEVEMSIDTMVRRPLINTRDEPHADCSHYRRLHQIVGDANLSEIATGLKIGTTWLCLRLIEAGLAPKEATLKNPIDAIHQVSFDTGCRTPICLENGQTISPIDHQRLYLSAAEKFFGKEDDKEIHWILETWAEVLDDLEKDPLLLRDRLDWVAKLWLMKTFMEAEKCDWDDPTLQGIDLEYHNLNRDRGLFIGLEMEGQMQRLSTDEAIKAAMFHPPAGSRAMIRGLCIQKFSNQIERVQWGKIHFGNGKEKQTLDLDNLFGPDKINALHRSIQAANNMSDLFLK